ncbi:MAG: ABC transporter ATP-binding protein [Polyangiaceae bacterium]|nr:ABC transporter ATP-binding protein [Polyangiaceae bacterium]
MMDVDFPVLSLRGVGVDVTTDLGVARVVDDVSFDVPSAGKVALVGESGSGKTMVAMTALRLHSGFNSGASSWLWPSWLCSGSGKSQFAVRGEALFRGRDLMKLSAKEMRQLRGNELSMVFQEPMTSLNPVLSVGYQIVETLRAHQKISRKDARDRAVELLGKVGMPSPKERVDYYPHQLSGGMRQRVMIAIAMCCRPALIIADEPTTALDVTIEASILDLLDQVREEDGTATLLITHDLGVVAGYADWVVVMYSGQVVESGAVVDVFRSPRHPYTRGLLGSLPMWVDGRSVGSRLVSIPGMIPNPYDLPKGCRFRDRCSCAVSECGERIPDWVAVGRGGARCVLVGG